MRIEGGAELASALQSLSAGVSKRATREALAYAAEPLRRRASQHARRRAPAPDIADNIVISTGRNPEGISVVIGPAKGFAYGLPLERGTWKMQAYPFMRPAFDETASDVLRTLSDALWRLLAMRGIGRSSTLNLPVQTTGGAGLL